MPTSYMQR